MTPDAEVARSWLELGVPGLLFLGNVVFAMMFMRERAEHIKTANAGREDVKTMSQALTAAIGALERVR